MDLIIKDNVQVIEKISKKTVPDIPTLQNKEPEISDKKPQHRYNYKMFLSLIYAFAVSTGSFVWFFNYIKFIIYYREKVKIKILNNVIRSLGVVLVGIAVYLIFQGVEMLI